MYCFLPRTCHRTGISRETVTCHTFTPHATSVLLLAHILLCANPAAQTTCASSSPGYRDEGDPVSSEAGQWGWSTHLEFVF